MKIYVIKSDKLCKYTYDSSKQTSFYLTDVDELGNDRNLLLIEQIEKEIFFISNDICYICDNDKKVSSIKVELNKFYNAKIVDSNGIAFNTVIYVCNEKDDNYSSYYIGENGKYSIGSSTSQNIILNNEYISGEHAVLDVQDTGIFIKAISEKYSVFVNDLKISYKRLETGDTIFIYGYRIILVGKYLLFDCSCGIVRVNTINIVSKKMPVFEEKLLDTTDDDNATLYNENDYFSRQPRFVTTIVEEEMKIDSPPNKQQEDDTPVLYTVGPMLTMTMTSAVSVATSISNLTSGSSTWTKVLPSLLVAGAMIASTLLWPSLLRKFNKKKQAKNEQERQRKYSEYLIEKKNKIASIKHNQHQILCEYYPEPNMLQNIVLNKKRNLWERQIVSEDFLNVRVGMGTIPLKLRLSYSEEDFSMIEDNLKSALSNVTDTAKDIPNCPVTINLTDRNKLVLVGETKCKEDMLKNIILQLATFHSYNDLKLVFMISESNSELYENIKILPHLWSNDRNIRFFADNYEDMSKISFYLEQVFISRKYSDDNGKMVENDITYKNVRPYYLIFTDNIKKTKNIEIISKILKEPTNIGFGLFVLNDGISNLPNEINDFLSADIKTSAIITNDLLKKNQLTFVMDNVDNVNFPLVCERISNIPIKSESVLGEMKTSLGFLEMYGVGKVEQLDVINRWQNNNPVNSLSVPIGIRDDGEEFMLDLHEKFHGPHGLIAGMTGSGKSEFIITYILSMCLNFSPEEVSFVLIDYKGGGLTGAFENSLTGIKLPHLAGTITNLDTSEIKRSLASIQSELKRRQELFNKAKLKLNESTLDIYKYQQLYRDGLIEEPVSHLFIISDEFAELKSQQQEFMQELISTARIGRSLGVHLILATQKPSGVVDDQIWSNSKFKVCLKVQERADSMDVIKCADAVTLKNAGRFYLQVGYNDFFAMGQSAYAGVQYIPKEKMSKTVNRDISILNNIGDSIKNYETVKRENLESNGEELPNILKYICACAHNKNYYAKKLWLDKIPNEIFVTNLIKKYNYVNNPWDIKAVVGEYDDPNNQKQDILALDFNNDGNTLVLGVNGNEVMLSSILYSLIINHSSDEINIYIIDFGSEMFGIFRNAPQVGDVVFVNEQEKLTNLFNTITRELEKRKKLFSEYNGDYNIYIKNSGKLLPRIMIMINNYEVLNETYNDFVDVISILTRECEKCGIFFVISASGANGVRGKTAQNFSNQLCMQFNDSSDYTSILGPTRGMTPSNVVGRGLVKIDGHIYEYQTAYPYKWEEINKFIKDICNELQNKMTKKVKKIAILPEHVRFNDIKYSLSNLRAVPIGIYKESLDVCTFDFYKNLITLISSQDISLMEKFTSSIVETTSKINNLVVNVIDFGENIKHKSEGVNYYTSDGNALFESIKNNANVTEKTNLYVIYGIDDFVNSLGDAVAKEFKTFLFNSKDNKNIRFIFIDSVIKFKTYEYDSFFRTSLQANTAIWLGSGINDQFTIKTSTYNKETRKQITQEYGYFVDKGVAKFVKLLDFYTED